MTNIANGPRLRKPVLMICNNKGADQPVHPRSLISNFVVYFLRRIISKINFLASLFSRRHWFDTRFGGLSADRISRVVACVACSTITSAADKNIKNKYNEEAVNQMY